VRAIEFITKPKDGVIKIPKEHIGNLQGEIRVIILIDAELESQSTEKTKGSRFSALQITTKGVSFDRDEANKR
jgi:hypothetical protein